MQPVELRSWKDPGHILYKKQIGKAPKTRFMALASLALTPLPAWEWQVGLDFPTVQHAFSLFMVTFLCWAQIHEGKDQGLPGDISRGCQGAR